MINIGYETPGYLYERDLTHIGDKLFKQCLLSVSDGLNVNLFEFISWLYIYGIGDKYIDEVCKIHGNMDRPREVKDEFKHRLETIIKYL